MSFQIWQFFWKLRRLIYNGFWRPWIAISPFGTPKNERFMNLGRLIYYFLFPIGLSVFAIWWGLQVYNTYYRPYVPFTVTYAYRGSCWGDFTVDLKIEGVYVTNDYCIEDGYSTTLVLSDNSELQITAAENFSSVKNVTVLGHDTWLTTCTYNTALTTCYNAYKFTLKISPQLDIHSVTISFPYEMQVGTPRYNVTYNCGPTATGATIEGFADIGLLPEGEVWIDGLSSEGTYNGALNCRYGELEHVEDFQVNFVP